MPRFAYQVRDGGGSLQAGELEAPSLADAARTLRNDGKVVVDVHEQAVARDPARKPPAGRVKRNDVIFFANQLAVMVDTGVPLADALDAIGEQSTSEAFRLVLDDLSEQVKSGTDFSAALTRHPKLFDNLFVSMVQASEASGTMGKMLQRVAKHLSEQMQLRRKIKGAMAYPVAMLTFCVAVVIAMLIFVLPRFEKIYAGKEAALPVPTRLLLGLSHGIITYWPVILAALGLLIAGGWLFFRRPEGRILLDAVRLKAPVLGGMYRKGCLARSLRTLSTMIATGVDMLESLEIAAGVSGNHFFEKTWMFLRERLKEGAALSEEMRNQALIPVSVSQMTAAGERTGKLGHVLDRVAGFCEEDLDISIKTVTGFIEPAMIVIMGAIVGGIAMALLLPVFSMSRVVAGH